ncbi:pilus assembly protein PilX [Moraxella bovis]|uniref:Pilus assembly protein PilX n=1 Tax=Moraxella bovis TaxID=476 RepID=A0A378PY98_MORBO|nr:pilus assembly protein PilX [Moraxella bovis]UYZ67764.1 pilus assembly protein PilX [Moraxella bovis]UYZ73952.1 pilus assembly protein PilX [Moraxella bovis]UYZ74985.1 pilus assembly protein PilX [Moraxella bovis]UYZ79084.1 pilus assembly protein PilX [Moraxella bovis]UYZ80329.1 pilus assembly protein PilX [Moraxella bovis]
MSSFSQMNIANRHQQGVALVVVLVFLIMILSIGVIALRKSSTDLKVATADQMDNVLLQSSESANQKLEAIVNGSDQDVLYKRVVLSPLGSLGYFINDSNNMGDEFVYCFNPRTNDYLRNTATIFRGTGMLENNGGICGQGDTFEYTSARQSVVTQVNLTQPRKSEENNENAFGFEHIPYGQSATLGEATVYDFEVHTTSLIPAYGTPGNCLTRRTTETNDTLMDCMADTGTPHKTIYQQVTVAQTSTLANR